MIVLELRRVRLLKVTPTQLKSMRVMTLQPDSCYSLR